MDFALRILFFLLIGGAAGALLTVAGKLFYVKMDEQVKRSLNKDWGEIKVDKEYLVRENSERKIGFDQKLTLIRRQSADKNKP